MENYGILSRIVRKIPKRMWIGFMSGIISGFLTHFYMFTNKLPNWDDIGNFDGYGQGSNIGRWFLQYVHPIGGRWSIPAVHGVIAIIFLTAAACLILETLELRRTVSSIIVPIALLTFPSVAGTMAFMFTVHAYAMAVMMMCLSVYLIRRYKYGFMSAGGMALIVMGMGIYQPYVSFAIGLMLLSMLSDLMRKKKNGKETFIIGIKYSTVLLVSVIIYIIMCRIFFPNISNETYGGVGQMGQISIFEMPRLIGRCYKRFLEYFIWKPFGYVSNTMHCANILVCMGIVVLIIYNLISVKFSKDKLAVGLCVILSMFIPFALAFIYFMAPEAPFSILMTYAYSLVYVFVLMLLEIAADKFKSSNTDKKTVEIIKKAAATVIILSVLSESYAGYIVTNEAYYRMFIAYERTTAFFNRILANVENEEGFNYGDKVAILGEFYYVYNPSPIETNPIEDYKFREMSGIALENGMITSGIRDRFIRMYLGFELPKIEDSEKEEILKSKEYIDMPCYPTAGCIKKLGDIWVVKLCD